MDAQAPIVETTAGKVRGTLVDGVSSFLGIRYATAERFAVARPPTPWAGVRDATAFGAIAPQTSPDPDTRRYGIVLEQLPRPPAAGSPPLEDEDCLFLNVWTSNPSRSTSLPVMVWLHSGFFMVGSGASGNGARLAHRGDVVVVSLNHRLNVFGYTHLDEIAGEDFRHSGNLGQLDIVAALEWVRENIAGFGGDPNRVMVFGSSGGGMKTAWLLASPRARGLLHRAGVQSGPCLKMMERETASEVSEALLRELGLTRSECSALRTLPAARLLSAYHALRVRLRPKRFTHLATFAPVLDPVLLPRHPYSPEAPAGAAGVPLLIGWNREDMAFFLDAELAVDPAELPARVEAFLGAHAQEALQRYRTAYPDASPEQILIRSFTDFSIMAPTLLQAERSVARGSTTYVYRFEWPSPLLGGRFGALHSLESHLVFDNVDAGRVLTGGAAEAHALAKHMSTAWAHFAARGTPQVDALGEWPAYDGTRPTMLLSSSSHVMHDPTREMRLILQRLGGYE